MLLSTYDLLVIGGGSAGLTAAKFAANFGKSVAIVEKARLGGDCTWTGCVPSKTLLGCANAAHSARGSPKFGVSTTGVQVDYTAIRQRVLDTVQKIYDEDDSPGALKKLGIDTIEGQASFLDATTLQVKGSDGTLQELKSKSGIVIGTGAEPIVPDIQGLDLVNYITYNEIFTMEALPPRLIVIGGGPIGCELSQAFSRLGSKVTLVASKLLPALDDLAGETIRRVLEHEGVTVVSSRAESVRKTSEITVTCVDGTVVKGDTLLVATGRRPVTEGMDLDKINVRLDDSGGILVDDRLLTTCKGVYAAGDCTGDQQFTHYAGFQGGIAARNALLPLSSGGVISDVPGCTFTSPEVAHIGMTKRAAIDKFGNDGVRVMMKELATMDRAICSGTNDFGFIQIVTKHSNGEILGCTIIAPPAGEMMGEISVAMAAKMKLPDMTMVMHAYPTYSMPFQFLGASLYYEKLKKNKKLYDFLKRIGL